MHVETTDGVADGGVIRKILRPSPVKYYLALGGVFLLLIWGITASISGMNARAEVAALRESSQSTLVSTKSDYEGQLSQAAKASLQSTADGIAATLAPFDALRVQDADLATSPLQSVVRNLVLDRKLGFIAITDSSGKVLASSDLTQVGRPLRTPSAMEVATARIGSAPEQGTVVVGTR
ncbi:hypothetical protein EON82_05860 [bacterium]|nr:MAG: hypothetical protein EON82_05860 [bacterium]